MIIFNRNSSNEHLPYIIRLITFILFITFYDSVAELSSYSILHCFNISLYNPDESVQFTNVLSLYF